MRLINPSVLKERVSLREKELDELACDIYELEIDTDLPKGQRDQQIADKRALHAKKGTRINKLQAKHDRLAKGDDG